MVEQGSCGMQTGQPQQEVRRKPVPIGDGLSQSPIADLWQTRQKRVKIQLYYAFKARPISSNWAKNNPQLWTVCLVSGGNAQ
jgi:hypothetical protein